MACPPFSEILMMSQNVRSGGERQCGSDLLILEEQHFSPDIGKNSRSVSFFVERKKSALRPRRNADFFKTKI